MTEERYAEIIDKIMAMDLLVRAFNDEDYIEPWLINGVPDGLEEREDYEDAFPNDKDLQWIYMDLTALFCRLIARQAASIRESESNTDFPSVLEISGDGIII